MEFNKCCKDNLTSFFLALNGKKKDCLAQFKGPIKEKSFQISKPIYKDVFVVIIMRIAMDETFLYTIDQKLYLEDSKHNLIDGNKDKPETIQLRRQINLIDENNKEIKKKIKSMIKKEISIIIQIKRMEKKSKKQIK